MMSAGLPKSFFALSRWRTAALWILYSLALLSHGAHHYLEATHQDSHAEHADESETCPDCVLFFLAFVSVSQPQRVAVKAPLIKIAKQSIDQDIELQFQVILPLRARGPPLVA